MNTATTQRGRILRRQDGLREVKFRKAGGSLAVTIPVSLAAAGKFAVGSIALAGLADDGSLIIQHKRPKAKRYTIDELMAEMPEKLELTGEQSTWIDMEPVGGELKW